MANIEIEMLNGDIIKAEHAKTSRMTDFAGDFFGEQNKYHR